MELKKVIMALFMVCMAGSAQAADVDGVRLPDTLTVDGANLILNGTGLRKKLIIKVYAAGLYLTEKDRNFQTIVDADKPMAIRMHFIYDGVSPKQLIET